MCLQREAKKIFKNDEIRGEMCYNNAHLLPAPFRFRAGRSGVIFLPEKPHPLREWGVKKKFLKVVKMGGNVL